MLRIVLTMFMDRWVGAVFTLFDKDSLQILCGIFILSLVVQHERWSPHIIRTSNAIQTNSRHSWEAGPYRPVYWKRMLTTASSTWTCFCNVIIALPFWNRRDELGTATKGRYCRTPHLNVMEPVNIPNKMFL